MFKQQTNFDINEIPKGNSRTNKECISSTVIRKGEIYGYSEQEKLNPNFFNANSQSKINTNTVSKLNANYCINIPKGIINEEKGETQFPSQLRIQNEIKKNSMKKNFYVNKHIDTKNNGMYIVPKILKFSLFEKLNYDQQTKKI